MPQNFFLGSLIPRQPFVGGRNATQSASRGDLDVQCRTDYLVANRLVWLDIVLPSKFLQRHAQQSSDKREKEDVKRNNYIRIKSNNLSPQPIQRYFSLAGGQSYRRLVPFIQEAQSPYLTQTFTTDFLSVVYLETVYFSFSPLYIDTKVN